MITYTYEITAATSIDGTYDVLEGSIPVHYPIPHTELRERAILRSPDKYTSFGVMRVLKEEIEI